VCFAVAVACGSNATVNASNDGGAMDATSDAQEAGDAGDAAQGTGDAQPLPAGDAAETGAPDAGSGDGPDASEPPDASEAAVGDVATSTDGSDAGCSAEIFCPVVDPMKPAHIDCVAPASLHVGDRVTIDIVGTNLATAGNPPIVEIDVVSPPGAGGQAYNGSVIDACHVQVAYVVPSQSGQVSLYVSPGGTIVDSNKVVLSVHN
jgi:hypothetical protein